MQVTRRIAYRKAVMADVDVEQLLHDLDNLDDSASGATSPSRNRESLRQARDMDDLTGTLDDLLQLTETGMKEEPKRGPLSRRTLRVSEEADVGSVQASASPGGGGFITPRPPLMPKQKHSPSSDASGHLTPRESGDKTATGDPSAASAHDGSTVRGRVISTDMESELENLLTNSQGVSESSSPIKAKSPAKSPVKAVQIGMSECGYGGVDQPPSAFTVPILDVDDFDDAPRCAMVGSAIAVIPPSAAPERTLSGDSITPARQIRTGSGASDPPDGDTGVSELTFTPLPVSGIITAANKQKCIRVTIGGSSSRRGCKASSFARDTCCGNLRCIKCNFSVVTFPAAKWDASVDYMFFRNANCDPGKLSPKLVPSVAGAVSNDGEGRGQGAECAYCCQCSWVTSEAHSETEVKEIGLQWSCGGHVAE